MFAYEKEIQFAMSLVKEGSLLFLPAFRTHKVVEEKASSSDLVTETDKAIEHLISSKVKQHFPEHAFIGEESVADDGKVVFDERPTWIVDPIDGTTNFVHQHPHTCIVIGFTVDRVVQFGVVYNPVLNQLYTGRRGFGAQLNGFPIHSNSTAELNKALLACEMGSYQDADKLAIKTRNMTAVCSAPDACHGLRMQGSAALNMCAVASGALDGYWECGMHIWDMAAASVILSEAGGVVVSPVEGEVFCLLKRRVVAACCGELGAALQKKIQHIDFPSD